LQISPFDKLRANGLNQRFLTVVHRSDGSGTTFIFTNYLSKASPEWKSVVGEGTAVSWKAGTGGKLASDLDYVPLPENVQNLIRKAWKNQIRDTSGSSLVK